MMTDAVYRLTVYVTNAKKRAKRTKKGDADNAEKPRIHNVLSYRNIYKEDVQDILDMLEREGSKIKKHEVSLMKK